MSNDLDQIKTNVLEAAAIKFLCLVGAQLIVSLITSAYEVKEEKYAYFDVDANGSIACGA
jgi:hypothetical protein